GLRRLGAVLGAAGRRHERGAAVAAAAAGAGADLPPVAARGAPVVRLRRDAVRRLVDGAEPEPVAGVAFLRERARAGALGLPADRVPGGRLDRRADRRP